MALSMRPPVHRPLNKMVLPRERIAIYLKLPVLYYLALMSLVDTGLMPLPQPCTSSIGCPQKSWSSSLRYRPCPRMSPFPRCCCFLLGYLAVWLLSTFIRTSARNLTLALFGVSSWGMPFIRRNIGVMIQPPNAPM
jgi:hypothetical protein